MHRNKKIIRMLIYGFKNFFKIEPNLIQFGWVQTNQYLGKSINLKLRWWFRTRRQEDWGKRGTLFTLR
jgi:hypothetical protein